MKAVLITLGNKLIPQQQIYPFYKYKNQLKKKFNFIFNEIKINDKEDIFKISISDSEIIFFQPRIFRHFEFSIKQQIDFLKNLNKNAKLVILDSNDATCARGFHLLRFVDIYIKKQFLSNLSNYKNIYLDHRIHADYFIKIYKAKHRYETNHWNWSADGKYGADRGSYLKNLRYWKKLVLGWNVGTFEYFDKQFKEQKCKSFENKNRSIDINCRLGVLEPPPWYYYHRITALNKIRSLRNKYRIVASSEKLSRDDYFNELRNSKICISPFGWGEVCLRDFEAIISGSLLIKPSMEHVTTLPNVYLKNKTYVPVEWDLSDLKEKCIYYLNNKTEREKIIKNAAKEYAKYFKNDIFLNTIKEVLSKLNF